MEKDGEGKIKKHYVYGMGLIGVENDAGDYLNYHFDSRGSTVALTDNDGKITDKYCYDEYGSILTHKGKSDNRFCYVGKYGVETDRNQLLYMRARYYNPEIKRFVNEDTLIGNIANTQSL